VNDRYRSSFPRGSNGLGANMILSAKKNLIFAIFVAAIAILNFGNAANAASGSNKSSTTLNKQADPKTTHGVIAPPQKTLNKRTDPITSKGVITPPQRGPAGK